MLIRIRIRIRNPAIFSACYFLKVHLHYFSKIKSQKESQNSRIQCFSYYFCMMIEGSGSIPLTSGSGSGRPKNTWIRWIRIRIRNTAIYKCGSRRANQCGSMRIQVRNTVPSNIFFPKICPN